MKWNAILSVIFIVGYIIYFFIILILLYIRYQDFLLLKLKENPKYEEDLGRLWVGNGGKLMAGNFRFRSPLPIVDNTKDKRIQEAINDHNKLIRVFWYSALGLIPLLILLNIIN